MIAAPLGGSACSRSLRQVRGRQVHLRGRVRRLRGQVLRDNDHQHHHAPRIGYDWLCEHGNLRCSWLMFFGFWVLFIFTGGLQKTKFFATIPGVEMKQLEEP